MAKIDDDRIQHMRAHVLAALKRGVTTEQAVTDATKSWERLAKREKRKAKRTRSLEELPTEPSIPSFLSALVDRLHVEEVLERLPPAQRLALVLTQLVRLSRSEVAASLGVSLKHVKDLVDEARRGALVPGK